MIWNIITALSSFAAVVVSALALWAARKANKDNSHLTMREAELVRLLLIKEQREQSDKEQTEMSARLYSSGKHNWKLRVFNRGPAEARNVRLEVTCDNSYISKKWINEKFPMDRMEAGQSVDLLASVHLGSHLKEDIRLIWDDSSAPDRSNVVTVTI